MVLVTPASDADEVTPEGTKKKKLQVVEKRDDATSRLVEYFVVVTSVPKVIESHISAEQQQQQQPWKTDTITPEEEVLEYDYDFVPKITARFPLYDHPDNPLHENVTFFCHPGGAINLRTEPYMPKVHYFVATGGHGKQMYGTCLTLWEPYLLNPTAEQKQVYLPKCVVLLSTYPYLMAFREFLTQLNRLSKMGEMTLPLERYIINFCCEIPAPPPGSFEVQTTILDSVIKIWSPPHNQPIPWVSLPFFHLFECLDLDNVVLVWRCLALERQVLLTSTQLSVLTTCAEILLSLLYPMRWSHAYISVLPHFLIPILSAPMPFLCGIHKANLAEALYDLSRECVVVDLDKNLVTLGPDTAPLPPLPPQQELKLCDLLEQNVGMVFREARSLTKNDDYSDSGQHLPIHIKLMAEAMWESKLCLFDEAFHLMFTPEEARKNMLNGNDASGLDWSEREGHGTDLAKIRIMTAAEKMTLRQQSQWDAVQEAFLDTYLYLLRNYRKFLVFPSKDNEGSYGGAGFRSKEFLDSQRYDMRAFLEQLIGTQMFDNFITKRLYGSGEADVAFFDFAVDRFLKNQGILADFDMSGRFFGTRESSSSSVTRSSVGSNRAKRSSSSSASSGARKDQEPLLQSARVHRRLKTIVPPEPSGEGLPPHPMAMAERSGAEITTVPSNTSNSYYDEDDNSVESSSTQGTHSTRSTRKSQTSSSPKRKSSAYQSVQDKAAEILEKQKHRYTYPIFPSTFHEELFGTPRPLPSAVIAEFDRQRKDAAQFRRKKRSLRKNSKETKKHFQRAHSMTEQDTPPSPEVATFTVFFMAFTAMVGKELLEISHNPSMQAEDKMIIANYVPTTVDEESDYEDNETNSTSPTAAGSSAAGTNYDDDEDNFEDAVDEDEKEGVAVMKTARPSMGGMLNDDDDDVPFMPPIRNVAALNGGRKNYGSDDGSDAKSEENLGYMTPEEGRPRTKNGSKPVADPGQPRQRFRDSLSAAQIEEAKAKGRAQLGLAFEMLTMMKKRALKADPELYQCLIDACGRVGDTKRATDLLAKMHEDGIVADGTVYACLVSAFSAESAWKQGSKEDEELPAWANSTSIEMDWNKLQKRSLLDRLRGSKSDDEEDKDEEGEGSTYQKLRNLMTRKSVSNNVNGRPPIPKVVEESRMEFFVTEVVERQIELGENLLEIVYPDISVDTDNETCPRCNFLMSDDDVVCGWTPNDSNDYTTSCPNCTQRFVPHFCVQSTSATFMGSRGPASPLMCERLSPWVLQKEIRTVMSDREGIENLLSPEWRGHEYKNAVLWWNLVLSCMRYRLPFSYLLQGSFEQNLIAPMPEDES